MISKNLRRHLIDQPAKPPHLFGAGDKRHHDFRNRYKSFSSYFQRSLQYCPNLHLQDLWIADTEAAAAMSHHRVRFPQALYSH